MLEVISVVIFFIVYNIKGIYYATFVSILVNFFFIFCYFLKFKKINFKLCFAFLLVLFFGGITLFLHDDIYIKLKLSIVYWFFGIPCLLTYFFKKKPFLTMIVNFKADLPSNALIVLNKNFGFYFILMGFLNLYIAYYFDTYVWVNFKIFGTILSIIIFIVLQYFLLFKILESNNLDKT